MSTPIDSAIARSPIVIVDDNAPSAELAQVLLRRAGFENVEAVLDPRIFLDRMAEFGPHLILLDLHMPGIDGYGVLAEVRSRASAAELPVVVLTADTTRDATRRALELGANDFLTKPLDAAEVVLRVRNLLRTRHAHEGLRQRERWLAASAELAESLLSAECPDPLHRVCELAMRAAEADAAQIETADTAGRLASRLIWIGPLAPDSRTAVIRTEVPVGDEDDPLGTLTLVREFGRPPFSAAEEQLIAGFASQAAIVVELAQTRIEHERLLLATDRHRIARDLHDQTIQRLYAMGLRLQQVASVTDRASISDRVAECTGQIDDTISEIRTTIFGLRQDGAPARGWLPKRLRALASEASQVLGFEPDVRVEISEDDLAGDLVDDVIAVAREALGNVARHAHVTRVTLSVVRADESVVVEVSDDGDTQQAGRPDTLRPGTRLTWRAAITGRMRAG